MKSICAANAVFTAVIVSGRRSFSCRNRIAHDIIKRIISVYGLPLGNASGGQQVVGIRYRIYFEIW